MSTVLTTEATVASRSRDVLIGQNISDQNQVTIRGKIFNVKIYRTNRQGQRVLISGNPFDQTGKSYTRPEIEALIRQVKATAEARFSAVEIAQTSHLSCHLSRTRPRDAAFTDYKMTRTQVGHAAPEDVDFSAHPPAAQELQNLVNVFTQRENARVQRAKDRALGHQPLQESPKTAPKKTPRSKPEENPCKPRRRKLNRSRSWSASGSDFSTTPRSKTESEKSERESSDGRTLGSDFFKS